MSGPADPLSAVTHEAPYDYYSTLVRTRPAAWDERLGMWVLASAAAVVDALAHPACEVRPPGEPVPRALVGTAAGEIFGRLARQTDGARHRAAKAVVGAALHPLAEPEVEGVAAREARRVLAATGDAPLAVRMRRLAFEVPVRTVAALLAVPDAERATVVERTRALVAGLAPGADAARVRAGADAARALLATLRTALDDECLPPHAPLRLAERAAGDTDGGRDAALANAVGLLVQAHDATAGLIGNSAVAMARRPEWWDAAAADVAVLRRVVREVARHDAPVQNTRRFVVRDATVAGVPMRRGDAILLVVAAANRDPAANADADAFAPDRTDARVFTFGAGVHACAGERVASAIATAALRALLAIGPRPPRHDVVVTYAPSVNARVPVDLHERSRAREPGGARR